MRAEGSVCVFGGRIDACDGAVPVGLLQRDVCGWWWWCEEGLHNVMCVGGGMRRASATCCVLGGGYEEGFCNECFACECALCTEPRLRFQRLGHFGQWIITGCNRIPTARLEQNATGCAAESSDSVRRENVAEPRPGHNRTGTQQADSPAI
eukprot:365440-Chlamydomonas_euryale.AAC.6